MTIAGIGGLHGDGACAVLKDGVLRAAIEESKLRHASRGGIPELAIAECLRLAGVTHGDVNSVAVVRPVSSALQSPLRALFPNAEISVVEHHLAHAASAFFASPFESAT